MKKLFLFLCLISSPVFANDFSIYQDETTSLLIDGYLAGYGVYNDKAGIGSNKFDLVGYGEIHFNAEKKLDENNSFGAYIELETNPYHTNKTRVFEETYIYGEGNYGRFEIGRAKNISRKIHIFAPDVGLLDIDDSYCLDYIFTPDNFMFIGSTAINTDREANKINYISPKIYGFQIAGSYIPGASDLNGDNTLDYDKFKNGYTLSLKYSYDGFALSAGMANFFDTNMPNSQADKRKEFSIGAKYYFNGIQLSASYKNIDDENALNQLQQSGYALNYGIAYEFGPIEASLSHHKSNVEGNILNPIKDLLNLSIFSVSYNLFKGVDFATSFGRIQYDTENNESSVGMLIATGFMINF